MAGGILHLIEDRPTPKEVYNLRIYACALVASFASIAIGYDASFVGTSLALPSFTEEFAFDSYSKNGLALTKANIVSVFQAGAFFGSLFAYIGSYYFGRNRSVFAFIVFFVVGAGLNIGANGPDLGLIIGGRVLTGLGVGGCSSLVPIYISELAPPAIRGRLVGLWELNWQIGGIVGFFINYGVNQNLPPTHKQWIIPFAVQLIPAGLLLVGVLFLPESPRWLLAAGRREKALKNLVWLRKLEPDHIYLAEEVQLIDDDIERHRRDVGAGFFKPFAALKNSRTQWRFLIGGLLFLFQNATGINAINYYSPIIFASIGVNSTSTSLLATGVYGVVKAIEVLVWLLFLVDRFGRRRLLMYGALGGSLCMWYIGAYVKIANPTSHTGDTKPTAGGNSAIFFLFLWTVPYSFSWSGIPWVLNSEIYDMNTRALGQVWAAANNWFWNFIITRFTPQIINSLEYGTYFLFAGLMLVSIIFVFFCVPETANVPLESMDRLWDIKPVRNANKLLLEELRVENADFRQDVKAHQVEMDEEHSHA